MWFEAQENFQKQSYRNRCEIATAQGRQVLSVPVNRNSGQKITEVSLSRKEPWHVLQWRSLEAAYGSSPFFEAIAHELKPHFENPPEKLWDFNLGLTRLMLQWLEADVKIRFSESFEEKPSSLLDLRPHLHPKKEMVVEMPRYIQVFEPEVGFMPNLSVLDLFFNLGRLSGDYLREIKLPQSFG